MILLLNGLFFVFHDFGIAIIFLVLIVRLILHPITKKGQVNMVRMQKQMGEFAPKVEELKKKYGNDKARIQQETMKLYREHGINPAGQMMGCIPLFIQMPVWFALFLSLSNNILMRHQPFHFTWIHDLTAQDALIAFSTPLVIPGVGWELTSFNLLPPLVAVFMYVQTKTQPRPKPNPNATDQQRQQQEMMQKMMPMMSIMMLFFFYKMPAGLNLYIMCSSMFGWIEQIRIRKHIKKQEDDGTFGKPPPPKDDPGGGPAKPRGPSWLQRLQKAAAEAQKTQASKRTKTKPRR
jgi:YidC/Oxa1 family membrane protein insertase